MSFAAGIGWLVQDSRLPDGSTVDRFAWLPGRDSRPAAAPRLGDPGGAAAAAGRGGGLQQVERLVRTVAMAACCCRVGDRQEIGESPLGRGRLTIQSSGSDLPLPGAGRKGGIGRPDIVLFTNGTAYIWDVKHVGSQATRVPQGVARWQR